MEESAINNDLTAPLLEDNAGIQAITPSSEEMESLLASRIRKRRWMRCYQKLILALSLPPLYFLAMEMTKEHCHFCHHSLDDNGSNLYIIVAAAVWGSLMASLYEGCGYWKHSWCASIVGGALAASGSLFTMWMLLKSIATNDVVFVFALVVGILGSMPGIMVYYVAKILCNEWNKQTTTVPAVTSHTSLQTHDKSPRERFLSDGTVPEHADEEEIV